MPDSLKYSDVTQKIIGCAMIVHSKMRSGYMEAVYQKCLAIELKKAGLRFMQEVEMSIYYDGICVGKRRVDFMVEEKIIVEIKALYDITDQHLAQGLNYLETHHLEIGLLINFDAKSLQFKRLINQQKSLAENNPVNPMNP